MIDKTRLSNQMNNVWLDYYKSNVYGLHRNRYEEHNGEQLLRNLDTLKLAKKVCGDWAHLLMQELNFSEELEDISKFFKKDLTKWTLFLESIFATGSGIAIYLSLDNQELYNGDLYLLDATNYQKDGLLIKCDIDSEFNLVIDTESNIYTVINKDTNISKSYEFSYKAYEELVLLRDVEYPNGKSIFADSLSPIAKVDMAFTRLNRDCEDSEHLIIMSTDAFKTETIPPTPEELAENPNAKPTFKRTIPWHKKIFMAMKWSGDKSKPPIEKVNFEMQTDDILKVLDTNLKATAMNCKLGSDYYVFDKATNSIQTATEVIDKNSELARNFKGFREVYKSFLKIFFENIFEIELDDNFCFFGDGIFTNDKYEREMALDEIQQLEVPELKVRYLVQYKQWDEEEARLLVNQSLNQEIDVYEQQEI